MPSLVLAIAGRIEEEPSSAHGKLKVCRICPEAADGKGLISYLCFLRSQRGLWMLPSSFSKDAGRLSVVHQR